MITHRMAWALGTAGSAACTTAAIGDTTTLHGSPSSLACQSGCSGNVGTLQYYCTNVDTTDNWESGERTYSYDIGTTITSFEAS